MLPCQPHATQHRAPLRYKHGFDGVEQRSQRLNRVHGKVRARCRLMTHCGLTLLGVLPAFAKGDALEVVSVDGIKNREMRFCSHEFRPPPPQSQCWTELVRLLIGAVVWISLHSPRLPSHACTNFEIGGKGVDARAGAKMIHSRLLLPSMDSVLSKFYISQSHIQAFLYTGMRFWLKRLLHDDCNGACVASAPIHGHVVASHHAMR